MATNGEAHSINTLLRYLLNIPIANESRGPYDEEAMEAAVHLATRSRKALHGYGVSPDDVRAAWATRRGAVPLVPDADGAGEGPAAGPRKQARPHDHSAPSAITDAAD